MEIVRENGTSGSSLTRDSFPGVKTTAGVKRPTEPEPDRAVVTKSLMPAPAPFAQCVESAVEHASEPRIKSSRLCRRQGTRKLARMQSVVRSNVLLTLGAKTVTSDPPLLQL